jgi:hypothetical protein
LRESEAGKRLGLDGRASQKSAQGSWEQTGDFVEKSDLWLLRVECVRVREREKEREKEKEKEREREI